jgi:hypothetical protein
MSISSILNTIGAEDLQRTFNNSKEINRVRSAIENKKQDIGVQAEIATLPFKKYNAAQSALAKV